MADTKLEKLRQSTRPNNPDNPPLKFAPPGPVEPVTKSPVDHVTAHPRTGNISKPAAAPEPKAPAAIRKEHRGLFPKPTSDGSSHGDSYQKPLPPGEDKSRTPVDSDSDRSVSITGGQHSERSSKQLPHRTTELPGDGPAQQPVCKEPSVASGAAVHLTDSPSSTAQVSTSRGRSAVSRSGSQGSLPVSKLINGASTDPRLAPAASTPSAAGGTSGPAPGHQPRQPQPPVPRVLDKETIRKLNERKKRPAFTGPKPLKHGSPVRPPPQLLAQRQREGIVDNTAAPSDNRVLAPAGSTQPEWTPDTSERVPPVGQPAPSLPVQSSSSAPSSQVSPSSATQPHSQPVSCPSQPASLPVHPTPVVDTGQPPPSPLSPCTTTATTHPPCTTVATSTVSVHTVASTQSPVTSSRLPAATTLHRDPPHPSCSAPDTASPASPDELVNQTQYDDHADSSSSHKQQPIASKLPKKHLKAQRQKSRSPSLERCSQTPPVSSKQDKASEVAKLGPEQQESELVQESIKTQEEPVSKQDCRQKRASESAPRDPHQPEASAALHVDQELQRSAEESRCSSIVEPPELATDSLPTPDCKNQSKADESTTKSRQLKSNEPVQHGNEQLDSTEASQGGNERLTSDETSNSGSDQLKSVDSSKPSSKQLKSMGSSKSGSDQLKSVKSSKPGSESLKSVESSKRSSEQLKSADSSRPGSEQLKSTESCKRGSLQLKPSESSKCSSDQLKLSESSKRNNDQLKSSASSKHSNEPLKSSESSKHGNEQLKFSESSKHTTDQLKSPQTSKCSSEPLKSPEPSKCDSEQQKSSDSSRQGTEELKSQQSSKQCLDKQSLSDPAPPSKEPPKLEESTKKPIVLHRPYECSSRSNQHVKRSEVTRRTSDYHNVAELAKGGDQRKTAVSLNHQVIKPSQAISSENLVDKQQKTSDSKKRSSTPNISEPAEMDMLQSFEKPPSQPSDEPCSQPSSAEGHSEQSAAVPQPVTTAASTGTDSSTSQYKSRTASYPPVPPLISIKLAPPPPLVPVKPIPPPPSSADMQPPTVPASATQNTSKSPVNSTRVCPEPAVPVTERQPRKESSRKSEASSPAAVNSDPRDSRVKESHPVTNPVTSVKDSKPSPSKSRRSVKASDHVESSIDPESSGSVSSSQTSSRSSERTSSLPAGRSNHEKSVDNSSVEGHRPVHKGRDSSVEKSKVSSQSKSKRDGSVDKRSRDSSRETSRDRHSREGSTEGVHKKASSSERSRRTHSSTAAPSHSSSRGSSKLKNDSEKEVAVKDKSSDSPKDIPSNDTHKDSSRSSSKKSLPKDQSSHHISSDADSSRSAIRKSKHRDSSEQLSRDTDASKKSGHRDVSSERLTSDSSRSRSSSKKSDHKTSSSEPLSREVDSSHRSNKKSKPRNDPAEQIASEQESSHRSSKKSKHKEQTSKELSSDISSSRSSSRKSKREESSERIACDMDSPRSSSKKSKNRDQSSERRDHSSERREQSSERRHHSSERQKSERHQSSERRESERRDQSSDRQDQSSEQSSSNSAKKNSQNSSKKSKHRGNSPSDISRTVDKPKHRLPHRTVVHDDKSAKPDSSVEIPPSASSDKRSEIESDPKPSEPIRDNSSGHSTMDTTHNDITNQKDSHSDIKRKDTLPKDKSKKRESSIERTKSSKPKVKSNGKLVAMEPPMTVVSTGASVEQEPIEAEEERPAKRQRVRKPKQDKPAEPEPPPPTVVPAEPRLSSSTERSKPVSSSDVESHDELSFEPLLRIDCVSNVSPDSGIQSISGSPCNHDTTSPAHTVAATYTAAGIDDHHPPSSSESEDKTVASRGKAPTEGQDTCQADRVSASPSRRGRRPASGSRERPQDVAEAAAVEKPSTVAPAESTAPPAEPAAKPPAPVKKKVGRPRKHPLPEAALSPGQKSPSHKKPLLTAAKAAQAHKKPIVVVSKPKRGRPPKAVSINQLPKKRGRPPKIRPTEVSVEMVAASKEPHAADPDFVDEDLDPSLTYGKLGSERNLFSDLMDAIGQGQASSESSKPVFQLQKARLLSSPSAAPTTAPFSGRRGRPRKHDDREPCSDEGPPVLQPQLPASRKKLEDSELHSLVRSVQDSISSQFQDSEDGNDTDASPRPPVKIKPKAKKPKLHVMMRQHKKRNRRKKKAAAAIAAAASPVPEEDTESEVASLPEPATPKPLPISDPLESTSMPMLPLSSPGQPSPSAAMPLKAARSEEEHLDPTQCLMLDIPEEDPPLTMPVLSPIEKTFVPPFPKKQASGSHHKHKKKKKRLKHFKSKHKNIVDPVFLADLDSLTLELAAMSIALASETPAEPEPEPEPEEPIEEPVASPVPKPPPTGKLQAFSKVKGKRKKKELLAKPRKAEVVKESSKPVEEAPPVKIPGKRGRKKKVVVDLEPKASEECADALSSEHCLPLKKRHKLLATTQAEAINNPTPATVTTPMKLPEKRKPGRPRKNPLPEDNSKTGKESRTVCRHHIQTFRGSYIALLLCFKSKALPSV